MDDLVKYQGRMIPRKGFRAFIYHIDGQKKLMNSWDEFERHVDNKDWFSSLEEIPKLQTNAMNESISEQESPVIALETKKRGRPKAGA